MTSAGYQECKYCHIRIIFPRNAEGKKLPPVNYGPDPQGTVAVQHTVAGGWLGRFLASLEYPNAPEKRHALHWCAGMERQRQRGNWTSAMADQAKAQRNRRGKRPGPQVTGIVKLPETLPGMGE